MMPRNPVEAEQLDLTLVGVADVTIQTSLPATTFQPGASIPIQVNLSHGGLSISGERVAGGSVINDAQVEAVVLLPDSSATEIVALAPMGNGLYQGAFSSTGTPGTYNISIRAAGNISVSGPTGPVTMAFTRQREQSVYVISPFVPDAVLFASRP
ncbi:MAG: hypothetical protein IPI01_10365 [Ignavibacteriae bacterium]|nr:hypothetical protein [Ignavibacteriota bacterium]